MAEIPPSRNGEQESPLDLIREIIGLIDERLIAHEHTVSMRWNDGGVEDASTQQLYEDELLAVYKKIGLDLIEQVFRSYHTIMSDRDIPNTYDSADFSVLTTLNEDMQSQTHYAALKINLGSNEVCQLSQVVREDELLLKTYFVYEDSSGETKTAIATTLAKDELRDQLLDMFGEAYGTTLYPVINGTATHDQVEAVAKSIQAYDYPDMSDEEKTAMARQLMDRYRVEKKARLMESQFGVAELSAQELGELRDSLRSS